MSTETTPVTLVDLMDRLVEVSEPLPVSMWPQTWGWAVVGIVLLVAIALGVTHVARRYRANAYRRAALAELASAGDDAAAVAVILRRTALTAYPRPEVCRLVGDDWLRFLESTATGVAFTSGPGSAVASAPYRRGVEAAGVAAEAEKWVRRHRAGLQG